MKRKVEEELEGEKHSMWSHGGHWQRGEFIGEVMAVKSAKVSASESIEHEAGVLFEIKGCPFVIERFGEETTTTDKGDKVYNLLLEFASGGTLDGLIQKSNGLGLPEYDVRRYTRSILEGIRHIHKCDYVHCDLKPDNLLLVPTTTTTSTTARSGATTSFVAKIADFGLAKKTKENYSRWRGTPRYLSPEALFDNKQDQSCDIWALGCIVFEMLTGNSPWDLKPGCDLDNSVDVTVFDHLRTSKIPAEISDVARDFLKSCLAMRSCERSTAERLLSHPFVAPPQPSKAGHAKLKVVNSSLGYAYGVSYFKPKADYRASTATVPRIHPLPGFEIPAGH
ncbi:mitogen-activated protein kinase kinase kinase 17-like [Prunus dulcis]|uniref:mitogen-activated protein kinase kinase kinase 17-like n=1 Tax=Prunus dulcis TaxID=3755 RepID=UPI001482EB2F|nr:mitogen-activated protein kinase kinase kinase 17-like [Prunus dulcis]